MKKLLFAVLVLLLALVAVVVWRSETVFQDRQPEPAADYREAPLDADAAVQRFAQALTYPTVSHDDRSNFDAQAFLDLQDFLAAAYPMVTAAAERTVINGFSLVYRLQGSDPALAPVLFMGHMDVVPVEESTRGDWTYPPFSGTVADGIVWGRGSVDDKIGVIAQLEALEAYLAAGNRPQRSIYLAFGHDEEVGGFDGAQGIADYFAQQGLRFDFVLDEGGAVTRGMIGGVDEPVAVIGVSEKGYVNLLLTVEAPGGHSSQPPEHTALGILARAIVRVEDDKFPVRLDALLPTVQALGAWMPFTTRMALANLWLLSPLVKHNVLQDKDSAAGVRTTTAATMASGSPKSNILPTRATAVINFRILPGETAASIRDRVVGLIDDPQVKVEMQFATDPSPVSPTDSRGFQLIASTIRAMDKDYLVAPYMVRGGTDAKYFYSVSPNVYRFLPVSVDAETVRYVHGIDEHISVDNYLAAVRFYYNLIGAAAQR